MLIQKTTLKKKSTEIKSSLGLKTGNKYFPQQCNGKIFKELTHNQNGDWYFCCMVGIVDGFINKLGV